MTPRGFYSPQDGICLFSLRLDKKTWTADSANKSVIESPAPSDEETHESATKLGSYSSKLWPYTGEVWNFFTPQILVFTYTAAMTLGNYLKLVQKLYRPVHNYLIPNLPPTFHFL